MGRSCLTGDVSLAPQLVGRGGRANSIVEFCTAHSELMWWRLLMMCAFVHLFGKLVGGKQIGVMVLGLREMFIAALMAHQ